jgi:hypothetical protein
MGHNARCCATSAVQYERPPLQKSCCRCLAASRQMLQHLMANWLKHTMRPEAHVAHLELVAKEVVLGLVDHVRFSTPDPLHRAKALLVEGVEVARGALRVSDDGRGLQTVGENDVWVHRGNVEMVDQWHLRPAPNFQWSMSSLCIPPGRA